jgi:manganese/zinc/iron transport system permease protein
VDLAPGCVLYGAIELTPLHTVTIAGLELPRAFAQLAVVVVLNAAVIGLFYKELKITSFDPEHADALGISSGRMHELLMVMTAVTAVAAFESVGSILVVAMLIVPAATAHLLTDRLSSMLLVAVVVAAATAGGGHLAAITLPQLIGYEDTNTAGMMAVVAGAVLAAVIFFGPRRGLLARWRRGGGRRAAALDAS